ncbi:G-type lectin S-receptor-like serine/threonine-protein kinase CES101 [Pyrus ussuriensis x Pyrus communis]|uniref:G-type lectin S-receptor-like serine/threonine-protein kinase CES101 n=1 Tax=Pyrus ussuriensis x Pyrus communis TaxID=2448454 RepID=A0A5N5FG23_9ROSA|nr:G-type lectin S-receptor-like serine/threonine-protein kinase CES101 [Pyrus ussuriensis x Pyrus communis]
MLFESSSIIQLERHSKSESKESSFSCTTVPLQKNRVSAQHKRNSLFPLKLMQSCDTLKPGESLNSTTYMCSAMGTFCLGFVVYDESNSSQLCIWGRDANNQGWIASRDKPVLYPTGVLTLDRDKTLKIMDQGRTRLELYSASIETANTNTSTVVATLLDSGNFILQEVNSLDGSKNRVLWQSFDHPTDTLYPDYFTYHSLNQTSTSEWLLTSTGLLYDFDGVDIARTDNCYGYNTDGGCQRWAEKPTCRHVGDIFELKSGFFRKTTSNSTFPIDSNTNLNTKKRIFIGTGITVATLLLMVPCIAWYVLRRRKFALSGTQSEKETNIIEEELLDFMKSDRPTDANARQNDGNMRHDLSVFSYASVMAATCNFSQENKLGQGGFGPGKLVTGQEVAVKRLSKCSGQGTLEFKNELILIYELQHKNLVKLFGFCIHGEERMLIYEYMPNKSLDYFLFGCGYMSPEYAMEGLFSIKSDVYSFGVLMLEIVSGRRNNSFYNADRLLNIVGYVYQLLRCVHVGLLCVEENAADRPTMSDVVSMLTNQSTPLPLPAKAAFFRGRNVVEDGLSGKKSEFFSSNEISNSTAVPR